MKAVDGEEEGRRVAVCCRVIEARHVRMELLRAAPESPPDAGGLERHHRGHPAVEEVGPQREGDQAALRCERRIHNMERDEMG